MILLFVLMSFFSLSQATVYVSLGSSCIPAYHLRNNGLRNEAYPFDWTLSYDIQGLFRALESDFSDFFLKENLKHIEAHHIRDMLYNMTYLHDFPFHMIDISIGKYPEINADWINSYAEIKEKYDRRIERLRSLKNKHENIIFFRYFATTKTQALHLKSILDSFFAPASCFLVVLNNTAEFKDDWSIIGLKNVYFEGKMEESWNENHFLAICNQLNIPLVKSRNIQEFNHSYLYGQEE